MQMPAQLRGKLPPRRNGNKQMDHTGKYISSSWPGKKHTQIQLAFCTAAARPAEQSAPGTSLPEQSELCAEWSNSLQV